MFADAFKLARCFTKPVVNSTRFFDKTVECECAHFGGATTAFKSKM